MKPALFNSLIVRSLLAAGILLLAACAGVETTGVSEPPPAPATGSGMAARPAFEEWSIAGRSVDSQNRQIPVSAAVSALASRADAQIARAEWQSASDTLERLLRIAPDYAPGWSRLSWLALQSGDAERARQMASRSNSYAAGRIDLKILNWGFIRDASVKLNDVGTQKRAERNIEELGNL